MRKVKRTDFRKRKSDVMDLVVRRFYSAAYESRTSYATLILKIIELAFKDALTSSEGDKWRRQARNSYFTGGVFNWHLDFIGIDHSWAQEQVIKAIMIVDDIEIEETGHELQKFAIHDARAECDADRLRRLRAKGQDPDASS